MVFFKLNHRSEQRPPATKTLIPYSFHISTPYSCIFLEALYDGNDATMMGSYGRKVTKEVVG
jgi:hypothetical protein